MYRMSSGAAGPVLVCTTAPVAPLTDVGYGVLAPALPAPRTMWILHPPGFGTGEALPANRAALVESQARALLKNSGPEPVVVAGYSSGGWLAHALAAHLEAANHPAAAVVLFDFYPPAADTDDLRARFMLEQVRRWRVRADGAFAPLDTQLSAMGHYQMLFSDWSPGELATPILHLAAVDALPGLPAPAPGVRFRRPCHTVVTLPGNHFNLLSEYARPVAGAVHDWLTEVL
jgi:thioesterase domain-containing protein